MFSQLQRSSLSVQLNLAEGYAYRAQPDDALTLADGLWIAVETGDLLALLGDARRDRPGDCSEQMVSE